MKLIGDKRYFAFEIGDITQTNVLIPIDTWLNNTRLTVDDNMAYLPQYYNDLKNTILRDYTLDKFGDYLEGRSPEEAHGFISSTRDEGSENCAIEDDQIYPYYRFMDWGPTTDNIMSFMFPVETGLCVTYEFWGDSEYDGLERKVNYIILQKEQIIPVFLELRDYLEPILQKWLKNRGS